MVTRMFIGFMVIPFFLITVTKTAHIMNEPTNHLVKGTWIWNTSLIESEPQEILHFSLKKGINEIYLHIDEERPLDYYRNFIKIAHTNGIQIYAVGGDPKWGLRKEIQTPLQFIHWVTKYNLTVDRGLAFDGIQFDIEPYLLPEWSNNQQLLVSEWMYVLNKLVQKAHEVNLTVSGVLPFWLDQITLKQKDTFSSLSHWMINRLDHVIIMAYRNHAEGMNGIIDISKTEIAIAKKERKPILIAVETMNLNEGEHLSFYQKGEHLMNTELILVNRKFHSNPFFKGIAVHHFESYRTLSKKGITNSSG